MSVPHLRMFAGPNGSGKSTIKGVLPPGLLGVYINPDDIQKEIAELGYLKLDRYEVTTTQEEILTFFQKSARFERPTWRNNRLICVSVMESCSLKAWK